MTPCFWIFRDVFCNDVIGIAKTPWKICQALIWPFKKLYFYRKIVYINKYRLEEVLLGFYLCIVYTKFLKNYNRFHKKTHPEGWVFYRLTYIQIKFTEGYSLPQHS